MDINSRGTFLCRVIPLILVCVLTSFVSPADSAPHLIKPNKKTIVWPNPCGPHTIKKGVKSSPFGLDNLELKLNLSLIMIARTSESPVYSRCKLNSLKTWIRKPQYPKSKKDLQPYNLLKKFYQEQLCMINQGFGHLAAYEFKSMSKEINPETRLKNLNDLKTDGLSVLCEIETGLNNTLKKYNFHGNKCLPKFKIGVKKVKTFADICTDDRTFLKKYKEYITKWRKIVMDQNKGNKSGKRKLKSRKSVPAANKKTLTAVHPARHKMSNERKQRKPMISG